MGYSYLMRILWVLQEMEATIVDGNGTETGHIIVTTIGGRNGQPKQVSSFSVFQFQYFLDLIHLLDNVA